jgi:hypothetical protein
MIIVSAIIVSSLKLCVSVRSTGENIIKNPMNSSRLFPDSIKFAGSNELHQSDNNLKPGTEL